MGMEPAKKYQENLKQIKKNIENSYLYFKDNYDRFNEFRKFVFQTTMSTDDISLLKELQKPQLEFNILEAYISRLRGEFSKQEPSFSVRAADATQIDPQMLEIVEAHLRSIFFDASNDNLEYDVYTDLLSGGFSVIKVFTEYANEMSFNQNIHVKRAFDPTLCGFDPLARKSHKGDGRYCFELYPKSRDEFEQEFGKEYTRDLKFIRNIEGFNWTYQNNNEDTLLVADYYEKKKKKSKIVQLVDGKVMLAADYDKFVQQWNDSGVLQPVPGVRGKPRMTELEIIVRYRMIENKVLDYVETDYSLLPLIFVDGNSVMIRSGINSACYQMTRPYIYNARGTQKLKNFAGQTLANELENMVMHKFKVPKEAIPAAYKEAYENVQKANVLVYNQFKDNDPNVRLDAPQEIARIGAPPEVTATFQMTDQITQSILGSYDASLGINNNQLSGVAIVEGATQSNSAAMPYIVGFLKGLNQASNIILDLIPKYYVTPRSIPIKGKDGKNHFVPINQSNGIVIDYEKNALEVRVEAGVNFAVQKERALETLVELMKVSPLFAQFMNSNGLTILLDNIEIRGIDSIKQSAEQWQKQVQQQQQQQMEQQQGQPNPVMAKLQIEQTKLQQDAMKSQSQLALDAQKLKTDQMKVLADLQQSQNSSEVAKLKADTERFAKEVELKVAHHSAGMKESDHQLKQQDQHHRHVMDIHDRMTKPEEKKENE